MSFSPNQCKAEVIDRTVAQVGPRIITLHDVQLFAPSVVKGITSMPEGEEKDKAWQEYFDETLELLIYDATLEIAANRSGVSTSEQEVQGAIVDLQERNTMFRDQVREILAREQKITPELYLFVKQIILKSKLHSRLAGRAIVTEEDIRYYLKQQGEYEFSQPEYNVDIVFFPDDGSYDVFEKAMKRKKTFEEAVEEAGQSVISMGWIKVSDLIGDMQDAFEEIIEPKSKKKVSTPVHDDENRSIIMRVNDIRNESKIPDGVRDAVTYALTEEQLEDIFKNWLERMKLSIIVTKYATR